MTSMWRRALGVCGTLALCGCAPTGPEVWWERERGSIDVGSRDPQFILDVADTVAVGADAPITVTTYGSSTCTRTGDTRVSTPAGVVRLEPWVLVLKGDANCTDDLRAFRTTQWFRPASAGRFTVRVIGTVYTPAGPALDSVAVDVVAR